MPFRMRRLLIDAPAVSSDGTSGMPPASRVESMREKFATWYFSQISPSTGNASMARSMRSAPRSVFFQRQKQRTMITARPASEEHHVLLRCVPIASMMTVMVGSLRIQVLKELGKLRHHVGDQEHQHDQHHRNQQRRIHQRDRQLLLEGQRHALKRDVAARALLPCCRSSRPPSAWWCKSSETRLCAANASESNSPPFTRSRTFSSTALQVRVLLPLDQQIERVQDRQAGFDQGQELLIENQKLTLLDLAPAAACCAPENMPRGFTQ